MSRAELLDAYRRGTLSRRGFVRGMGALGVSIATANHLADQVAASTKPADDVYDADRHTAPKPTPASAPATVIELPSTGTGADARPESTRMKILGLMGASAALAATGFRRLRRISPDTEDQA